jgi:hypothetical protein
MRGHFQTATICHGFVALFFQPLFEFAPKAYLDDFRIDSAVTLHSAAKLAPWLYNAEISRIAGESGGRVRACHLLDPMLGERTNAIPLENTDYLGDKI